MGFVNDDVTDALAQLDADIDWRRLIDRAVYGTQEEFIAHWASNAGYELKLTGERPASLKGRESRGKYIYLGESLGLTVNKEGEVTSLTPGMMADQVGMFEGLQLIGVDGYKFSTERLRKAVEDSPTTGKIELLALDNEKYRTYLLHYDGGHRYLHAVVVDEQVDRLALIAAPRRPGTEMIAAPETPDAE